MKSRFIDLFKKVITEEVQLPQQDKDILYNGITLAIVPGSFKPPHKGHWEMIMKYVQMADRVLVLISNISTKSISERPMNKIAVKDATKAVSILQPYLLQEHQVMLDEVFKDPSNITYRQFKEVLEKILASISDDETKAVVMEKLRKIESALFKSIRRTSNGGEVTPEKSLEIFQIYADAYGVLDKVKVEISKHASPITSVFDIISNNCGKCKILLGVSSKGGDEARWNGIAGSDENGNEIIPTPVEVDTMLSATDIRNSIDNLDRSWFPDKLSDNDIELIKEILER